LEPSAKHPNLSNGKKRRVRISFRFMTGDTETMVSRISQGWRTIRQCSPDLEPPVVTSRKFPTCLEPNFLLNCKGPDEPFSDDWDGGITNATQPGVLLYTHGLWVHKHSDTVLNMTQAERTWLHCGPKHKDIRDFIATKLKSYKKLGIDVSWLTVPRVGDDARFLVEHMRQDTACTVKKAASNGIRLVNVFNFMNHSQDALDGMGQNEVHYDVVTHQWILQQIVSNLRRLHALEGAWDSARDANVTTAAEKAFLTELGSPERRVNMASKYFKARLWSAIWDLQLWSGSPGLSRELSDVAAVTGECLGFLACVTKILCAQAHHCKLS